MKTLGAVSATLLVGCCLLAIGAVAAASTLDASTPVAELKTAAAAGNADAMLELGQRLIHGEGIDKNVEEGLSWLHKAAVAGKDEAWYVIGFVHANGLLGKPDIAEAMNSLRKGAELGNADCQASMGLFYQAGERIPGGVKSDPAEALKWYSMAAEQGHTEAIQHLAMMLVRKDPAGAQRWFRKGAELGSADCLWGLGQCYLEGRGVKKDIVMAYALLSASLDGVQDPGQREAMTKMRDNVGKGLTPEQLKNAEPLVAEWKAKLVK